MKNLLTQICLLILIATIFNSNRTTAQETNAVNQSIEERLSAMEAKLRSYELASLVKLMNELSEDWGELDPTIKSFSYAKSNAGKLLIACTGVESYLDGYKINLEIGNPLAMSFSGFKLRIRYGTKPPETASLEDILSNIKKFDNEKYIQQQTDWYKNLQYKNFSFTETLPAGSWQQVTCVISPAKMEDIAYFAIRITTNTVNLAKPPVSTTSIPVTVPISIPTASQGAIESQIDGTFSGWDGDTIFPLINGQIWQQASYAYRYHYAYRPKVIIYRADTGYKMKVDGIDDALPVKRIK